MTVAEATMPDTHARAPRPWANTVLWPCQDLPFRKTVREAYFRRIPMEVREALNLLAIALTPACLFALSIPSARMAVVHLIVFCIVVRFVTRLRTLIALRKAGVHPCLVDPEEGRDRWAQAERQSARFQTECLRVGQRGRLASPEQAAQAWENAPRLPPLTRCLDHDTEVSLAGRYSGLEGSLDALRGQLLIALGALGGRSVVGRVTDENLVAIMMFERTHPTQYWVFVKVSALGGTTARVTIHTGCMWWVKPDARLVDGTRLRGDVRHYRRSGLARIVSCQPRQFFGWLVVSWILWPVTGAHASIVAIWALWRNLSTDRAVAQVLHNGGSPVFGDSLDLALLMADRPSKLMEATRLSDGMEQDMSALQQAATKALVEQIEAWAVSEGEASGWH